MAIDTVSHYHEGMKFPLWCKVTTARQNDYKIGDTYKIRIEDSDRAKELGDESEFNYVHEALLIAMTESTIEELPELLIAYCGDSRSRDEALDRMLPSGRETREDRELVTLVFLRIDRAKEFVTEGPDMIPGDFSKETVEDNS